MTTRPQSLRMNPKSRRWSDHARIPRRRITVASVILAAAIAANLVGPVGRATADSPPDQELRPGRAMFWAGEFVEPSGPEDRMSHRR